ncbi:MAG: geranylgeranyl reductase family protein [Actinobacteria bacterium]|nr:geranylgeranyl reductase family protein [Actinomycetota bacterium]
MTQISELSTDVLVIGAGPAGSSAAAWCARHGIDVLLVDAQTFPRDKACGDGLTPRAVKELNKLGLGDWLSGQARNTGLCANGFGKTLYLPWPGGNLPDYGSAAPRLILDAVIRDVAIESGAKTLEGARAFDVDKENGKITSVLFKTDTGDLKISAKRVVVADGAKSQLGRILDRKWHKDTVYGVAARGYISSERSQDPWITSHLELRGTENQILSGYGWIFPLADGNVNIGVGTLATTKRPADINLRQLMDYYADSQREEWKLSGEVQKPWSALLPMGGAVSNVAGANWIFVGDAAGCVNPLNGEGIDYGLETGRLAADYLASNPTNMTAAWPEILRQHYGLAFSAARRIAGVLTSTEFLKMAGPIGMRSTWLMEIALRIMGNLVTEQDKDALAKLWRALGKISVSLDHRKPFS